MPSLASAVAVVLSSSDPFAHRTASTVRGGVMGRRKSSDRSGLVAEVSVEGAEAGARPGSEEAISARAARRVLGCVASSALRSSFSILSLAAAARFCCLIWILSCVSLFCRRRRWALSRRFLSNARARVASRTASISQHSCWKASSSCTRERFAETEYAIATTDTMPSSAAHTSASIVPSARATAPIYNCTMAVPQRLRKPSHALVWPLQTQRANLILVWIDRCISRSEMHRTRNS